MSRMEPSAPAKRVRVRLADRWPTRDDRLWVVGVGLVCLVIGLSTCWGIVAVANMQIVDVMVTGIHYEEYGDGWEWTCDYLAVDESVSDSYICDEDVRVGDAAKMYGIAPIGWDTSPWGLAIYALFLVSICVLFAVVVVVFAVCDFYLRGVHWLQDPRRSRQARDGG